MTRSNNIFLIPGVGHLDLLVKLLGCGVESAVARRATNRGLGFDVATHLPTTYTHWKVTKAGVGRVVETCAAMFAANLISSSHFCKVLSGFIFLFTVQRNGGFVSSCDTKQKLAIFL